MSLRRCSIDLATSRRAIISAKSHPSRGVDGGSQHPRELIDSLIHGGFCFLPKPENSVVILTNRFCGLHGDRYFSPVSNSAGPIPCGCQLAAMFVAAACVGSVGPLSSHWLRASTSSSWSFSHSTCFKTRCSRAFTRRRSDVFALCPNSRASVSKVATCSHAFSYVMLS